VTNRPEPRGCNQVISKVRAFRCQPYDSAAESQLQIGEIYIPQRFDNARKSFSDASKIAQDQELRCRALSSIARIYGNIGPYSLADSYSRQALTLCEHLSERAQAEALEARGEVLHSGSDYSGSADFLRRATSLFVAGKDDNRQAQALFWLAYALFEGGERVQAFQAAGEALRLWSLAENRYGVAQCVPPGNLHEPNGAI
jgi:tetratricopeptide (TPR) repeat protein